METKLQVGQQHTESVVFTQQQVATFAEVSGDNNPLHLDADFAAGTPFKKPIVHGVLSSAVFSKILGTQFPGQGTIYLGQQVQFLRPVYPGHAYTATAEILKIDSEKHRATISTVLSDNETGKPVIKGEATVQHPSKF